MPAAALRLAGKVVGIFIDFMFEDLEVMYPKIRLEEEGATGEPSVPCSAFPSCFM